MSDIMMCDDNHCPHNKTCYRYLADPNEYRQAWFSESPYNRETDNCPYYWDCCPLCRGQDGHHKMSCPTQKIVINLQEYRKKSDGTE